MGHPDTRVHYLARVNVSTRPYYPANVNQNQSKEGQSLVHDFFYYLDGLNRDGEKFNLGFLL